MTAPSVPAARAVSTAVGFLMVAAIGIHGDGAALVAGTLAAAAVCAGIWFRPAATAAVLIAAVAILIADPPALLAALAGLAATAYLALRHAVGSTAVVVSAATVVGAGGFALVVLAATAVPLRLAWLPLLAPVAVLAVYALAVHPLVGNRDEPGYSETVS